MPPTRNVDELDSGLGHNIYTKNDVRSFPQFLQNDDLQLHEQIRTAQFRFITRNQIRRLPHESIQGARSFMAPFT